MKCKCPNNYSVGPQDYFFECMDGSISNMIYAVCTHTCSLFHVLNTIIFAPFQFAICSKTLIQYPTSTFDTICGTNILLFFTQQSATFASSNISINPACQCSRLYSITYDFMYLFSIFLIFDQNWRKNYSQNRHH
jgi:hypothetical protein